MTPEDQAQLQQCVDTIAQIFYRNSEPEQLQSLEGIEQAVREQAQAHVLPQLGLFLSPPPPKPHRAIPGDSKASSENSI